MFKLEWLDESARAAHNVDVTYWAVDSKRNATLHVKRKHWQELEYGDYSQWFILRIGANSFEFQIQPADNSPITGDDGRREYVWEKIISHRAHEGEIQGFKDSIEVLKEALSAYGGGWIANRDFPNFQVTFQF